MIWQKQKCWFVSGHHPRNVWTLDSSKNDKPEHSYHLPSFSEQKKLSIKLQKSAVKAASWQSPESVHILCCKGFSLVHQKHSLWIYQVHNSVSNCLNIDLHWLAFESFLWQHAKNRLKKPLSREPPPKRPPAFQATPLNSVLMRLESWHGKLQLSKCHGPKGCKNKPRKPKEQHPWTLGAKSETKQNYVKQLSTKNCCTAPHLWKFLKTEMQGNSSMNPRPWFSFLQFLLDLLQTPRQRWLVIFLSKWRVCHS